jgi:hypothetical protein
VLEQQTRAANRSAFDATAIHAYVRQPCSAPRLVTVGAVRDLTAGGSGGSPEFFAGKGKGKQLTRLG